ncbi:MAG: Gfo/Idh/MocA family oxidoreductase [Phycisphaerae bacterium]|nr:Gfo/Idh/MocA family oxidoreductase [Phycisphaerae bacterium]
MDHSVNRREFIGTAAGMAAGMVLPEAVRGAGIGERDIRLGIIGVGGRGQHLLGMMLRQQGAQVPAVCDIVPQRADQAAEIVAKGRGKRSETYTKGPEDYLRMLQRDDLDAVVVATPMQLHAAMSVAAMRAGKHVLSEVAAACTLEECWDLVRAVEETGKTYMLSENCCYVRECLMLKNMIERGLFGKITYAECAYVHDCRVLSFNPDGSLAWRGRLHVDFIGNLYPTHSIGPIAQSMGINRTDRFASLVAFMNRPEGHAKYAAERFGKDHPSSKIKWQAGDSCNALIRTEHGAVVDIRYDTSSPRPVVSTTHYLIQGTKGVYVFDGQRIYIEGRSKANTWEQSLRYLEEFEHPLWKQWGKEAGDSGLVGGDYMTTRAFIEALRAGTKAPIDVYDAVVWSSLMPLTAASIRAGGQPQAFPDFMKGATTRKSS